MDSNQTRFQLVLGRDDWARCTDGSGAPIFSSAAEEFSWHGARSEVTLGVRLNVFHSAPGNVPPTLDQRRGAGQDRFGNFYWIAGSGTELLVNSAGSGLTTHFWTSNDELGPSCGAAGCARAGSVFKACQAPTPPAPLRFSGLTVTERHYLIAGVVEPAGFVVFDLFHGGPPRRFVWPAAIPFAPFAMAPAPGGGVWILDRANARLWELDRAFATVGRNQAQVPLGTREAFGPVQGAPASPAACAPAVFPAGISLEMASPLGSIDAIALAPLPDGSVLLLDGDGGGAFSLIHRFGESGEMGSPVSLDIVLELLEPEDRAGFALRGFDMAFMAVEQTPFGSRQNTLYVAGANGDQAWAFTVAYGAAQLVLTPLAEYYPMRQFGGRGLIAGPGLVSYDSLDRWVPLVTQKRPRYQVAGTIFTKVFDGKQPDCVWHKLVMDAAIPGETAVEVFSRAHNDPAYLAIQEWMPEPTPYQRGDGCELPWVTEAPGLGAWELAFQRAKGQYLQLMIVVSGSGRTTPRLRALRAYYPRFSYRDHYLPAVYRQDMQSASFVDRFLANIEGFFTSTEDRIATVQALLDARSAPADALDWLANWFGAALDPAWTERKRRLFLENAAQFFEMRGTVPGLLAALRLALEDCADARIFQPDVNVRTGVRIVEGFSTRILPAGMWADQAAGAGIPVQLRTTMWTPSQGAADLDQRYATGLQLPAGTAYPIAVASTDAQFAAWTAFSLATLGFVPARPDAASNLWAIFLGTRYGVVSALNAVYQSKYLSFFDVPFPSALPRQAQPLLDWYQFQGILLVAAAAHRFTVYLPLAPGDAQSTDAQRATADLARRVIELEKPAHTVYDIQFYWAFFRVGGARLGEDTVLDQGSRAAQVMLPAVLGDTYTGSTYLSCELPGEPRPRPFLKQRSC